MTECNRCGDCCEDIWTNWTRESLNYKVAKYPPALSQDYTLGATALNARFINQHWHNVDGDPHRWTCDAFDPVARLCTAQENKPPVCSGFPWYKGTFADDEPFVERVIRYPRCAYWADLPINTAPVAVAVELGVP